MCLYIPLYIFQYLWLSQIKEANQSNLLKHIKRIIECHISIYILLYVLSFKSLNITTIKRLNILNHLNTNLFREFGK